jgi:hypothetical protein
MDDRFYLMVLLYLHAGQAGQFYDYERRIKLNLAQMAQLRSVSVQKTIMLSGQTIQGTVKHLSRGTV